MANRARTPFSKTLLLIRAEIIEEIALYMLLKAIFKESESEAQDMEEALKERTPVDTGAARDSWTTRADEENMVYYVESDCEYMEELNEGHSDQAPPGWIEDTAYEYGDPAEYQRRQKSQTEVAK